MSVPPHDPLLRDRQQWGTGLPGIPSIWDTAPVATEPAGLAVPGAAPRRRWAWIGIGLVTLAVVGAVGVDDEQTTVVAVPGSGVIEPGPPPGLPGPGAAPPPGPFGVVPPPQPGGGLVAQRQDRSGEPFGLPVGATVLLTDATDGSRLDVTVLAASRSDGQLLVDLQLQVPAGAALVPRLLLRLPDGRDVGASGVVDGQVAPPVMAAGDVWSGTLVFAVVPASAVLVLDDGRALAGWVVPAG